MTLDETPHNEPESGVKEPRVAVLIPCYNEEQTIAEVVRDFRRNLPEADIFVFDNNSSDRTVEMARAAGATVRSERRQGKGYVVQAMFRDVQADLYIMVDGDTTYPADVVRKLMAPVERREADMVIGSRLHDAASSQFRVLNRLGNLLYRWLLNSIFGVRLTDLLSGYRVFSRRLVGSLPLVGGGFETEAEMTIKAIERGFTIVEVPVNLTSRPDGSHSKIRLVQDGWLILSTILTLFRDYKPLTFFGAIGIVFVILGLIPGGAVIIAYVKTGLVPRLPSVVLGVGLVLIGVVSIFTGLILHTIARRFQELDRQLQLFESALHRVRARD
ncbi:MAG: glycosyltransferase family 2 protein [Acidobacteriota bacterium]